MTFVSQSGSARYLAGNSEATGVEEVPFAHFARGQRIWVRSAAPSEFDAREVVCLARSRVGEDRYRLLTNNCEHFCEWCLHGMARSFQVEAWLARLRLTLLATKSSCTEAAAELLRS
jgi:hypothetical protein